MDELVTKATNHVCKNFTDEIKVVNRSGSIPNLSRIFGQKNWISEWYPEKI